MRNVCVVGDDDQSIYGWRGAEVGNILDFEKHFSGATCVKLEENYRSRPQILRVANAAIKNSTGKRYDKALRAARPAGDKVRLAVLPNPDEEAKFIAREIRALMANSTRRFGDIAVLYRSNKLGKGVEDELRIAGIPCRIYGGTQSFDRKEVKDAIAFIKLLVYPNDDLALRRIVNFPPRGVGHTSIRKLDALAEANGASFFASIKKIAKFDFAERTKRGVNNLLSALEDARKGLRDGSLPSQIVERLFVALEVYAYLGSDGKEASRRRVENVRNLVRLLERFEKRVLARGGHVELSDFVNQILLRQEDADDEDGSSEVILSSLHSSKGLEFDVVFLAGVVEGQLPHTRTLDPKSTEAAPTDIDEERRLFYVGVTRAQNLLYITRPAAKAVRGTPLPLAPSRFLDDLPDEDCELYEERVSTEVERDELADLAGELLAELRAK